MSSSGVSRPIPFRSKKPLMSSSSSKPEPENPKSSSPSLATPEKILGRTRNRSAAFSVKEIRQVAQTQRRSKDPTDEIKSARKQILSWPSVSSSSPRKPKNTVKSADKEKLPEKYEILGEFFDGLDSAIRLSKLKGAMPTFANISPKIECLTDRRFSYTHLAQLKYILPEAVEIKRVLMFDERTSCMKPDLHVTLNVDAIEYDEKSKSESKNISLRKVFHARLADFVKAHPEGDEIPEESLPEPFNRSKQNIHPNITVASSSHNEPPASSEDEKPAVASHVSRFSKRLYKISSNNRTISAAAFSQTKLSLDPPSKGKCPSYCNSQAKPVSSCPSETPSKVTSPTEEIALTPSKPTSTPVKVASTPVKVASTPVKVASTLVKVASTTIKVASTPVKVASTPPELASTPARLMSVTPAPQPQKRSYYMSPDDNDNSAGSTNKLVRRPPRPLRSLKFETHLENEKAEEDTDDKVENVEVSKREGASVDDDDILGILPESLLQSIKEQEKKAMEDQDPAISQAKRRRKMIACLPKLFNVMHFLFQSIRRTVITKEEFMHKIIAGHSDIVDRREVEEQLNLMLELVPEWISEKRSFSGDLLICINKTSAPESIRARLEEDGEGTAPVAQNLL